MQERIRNEAHRSVMVCVDSYDQNVMTGRFYSEEKEEGIAFCSLVQLLSGIEQHLNNHNYPQSFTAMRSFSPALQFRQAEGAEEKQKKGTLGTFVIRVLFRQQTSWQGTIVWMEGKCEQTFRSVLELIFLMDSALNGRQEDEQVS